MCGTDRKKKKKREKKTPTTPLTAAAQEAPPPREPAPAAGEEGVEGDVEEGEAVEVASYGLVAAAAAAAAPYEYDALLAEVGPGRQRSTVTLVRSGEIRSSGRRGAARRGFRGTGRNAMEEEKNAVRWIVQRSSPRRSVFSST